VSELYRHLSLVTNIDIKETSDTYAQSYITEEGDIILIPKSYERIKAVWALFHEIGHILDARAGKKFKSEWDSEISAWNWSWNSSRCLEDNFKDYVEDCLRTYHEGDEASFKVRFSKAWKDITKYKFTIFCK
tara:strand:+ start:20866 stop:21261 length:396 start_codon:yes stop_codon:yes gene_type:complete